MPLNLPNKFSSRHFCKEHNKMQHQERRKLPPAPPKPVTLQSNVYVCVDVCAVFFAVNPVSYHYTASVQPSLNFLTSLLERLLFETHICTKLDFENGITSAIK